MLIELHTHTNRYSKCSHIDPVALVKSAVARGLQGLVITEHHYLWNEEELKELRTKSEINESFLLLSAQEVETDIGHVLVFGAPKTIPEKTTLAKLKKAFPKAALVWAHPFRNGSITDTKRLLDKKLDAIETFSSNHSPKQNYRALKAWHELKFTAVSGSDTHDMDRSCVLPTQFDHPVLTIGALAQEIKHGRCRPFFKEIPKSGANIVVTEITFGTKGDDETRDRLILKKYEDPKDWARAVKTVKLARNLYEQGFDRSSAFRVPEIIDVDEDENVIIEESQRGKNLFDVISNVAPESGIRYYEQAARWLAKLHSLKLQNISLSETIKKEEKRFKSYKRSFISTNNPFEDKAVELIDFVRREELEMMNSAKDSCFFVHGDFHPKNIIIGQDRAHDPSTLYVSVIDFDSSLCLLPAFDAAYFLTQFASQFFRRPDILKAYDESRFLKSYIEASGTADSGKFYSQTAFFRIRAALSIASFLIRVGKGESEELKTLINDSFRLRDLISFS